MNRLFNKLTDHWPILGILLISVLVALTNYSRGTFLTGWDNLHPEFNFPMNIYRSLFAVWQEYQGVGLLGGMAHASDLPRQLFLWASSVVIPESMLRYFYHFLMLPVGMLGIYFLLKNIFLKDFPEQTKRLSAFGGSLFYLLNLGTIQYFYVPFEPYSTFWGIFPWEIYTLFRFLSSKTRKNFLFFVIANIAGIAQAYVQTIFLVYVLCVSLILGITYLETRARSFLKTAMLLLGTIFVINAFWLLPNLYFVATNLSVTQNAIQNHMATEKFFQMNKARGTVTDLPVLKEFYFDFFDFNNETGTFDYLMKTWRDHFSSPLTQVAGYLLFVTAILGIIMNKRYRKVVLGLSALCLLIFLSGTPAISVLNDLFRAVPVVNQIFRNPFTKFIVPLIFLFALGLGMGLAYLSEKFWGSNRSFVIPTLLSLLLIGITTYPVFQGQFISPSMRVAIPKSYFNLFEYFKDQDKNARIMNLPQGSFWGWYYYRWGLRGSGFLWYGIEQPILDRAFDVWSRENEDYYWELSYALQKRDQHLFNSILEKYQIQYILFDKSILFADNVNTVRFAFNQEALLEQNDKLQKDATFGDVTIYKVTLHNKPTNFILGSTTPPTVSIPSSSTSKDQAFQSLGMYQNTSHNPSLLYPLQGLFTSRTAKERSFTAEVSDATTILSTKIPGGKYELTLPSFSQSAHLLPVSVEARRSNSQVTIRLTLLEPTVTAAGKTLKPERKSQEVSFSVPANSQTFYVGLNNADFFYAEGLSSGYKTIGQSYLENSEGVNFIRLYQGTEKISHTLSPTSFDEGKLCGKQLPNSRVKSIAKDNALSLQAQNTANCTVFKTSFTDLQNSLIKVNFSYASSSDEFPQYCYYSEASATCLNKKDTIRTGFSKDKTTFTDYFENVTRENDQGFFHLILEAQSDEDKNQAKAIEYSDIKLSAYPYIAGSSIPLTLLKSEPTTTQIESKAESILTVSIPTPASYYTYQSPVAQNIYKTSPLNYDDALPGDYNLEEIQRQPKLLRTSASHASSYLLFRANNLSAGSGYLVKLETDHKMGFPFTVNIFTNKEFRSYVYTFATNTKGITSDYFVLPPLYAFDQGVSVLLGSNSYNSTPTINDLVDISLTPLPYDYLTAISLTNTSQETAKTTKITAHKDSLSHYVVTPSQETEFLTLSQGYNDGWQAYQITPSDSAFITSIKRAVPFLFGKKLEHVRVNNWENGWKLPANNHVSTVVITYIPQITEFVGFGVALAAIILGIILHLRSQRRIIPAKRT